MNTRIALGSALALGAVVLSACQSEGVKTEAKSSATQSSAASTPPSATTTTSGAATASTNSTTSDPATTPSSAATPAGDKVGAADLPWIVSNRTFRGDDEGTPYSEFYAPDGSLRGKSGTETYTGTWKVVGEQLCFDYPDKGGSEVSCYAVFKNGDVITWVDQDGEVVEATYAEGNPDNL